MLILLGCILFDQTPYLDNVYRLTDEDGDGWTLAEEDCDDADATVYPTAEEICDHKDNDCDRELDEVVPETTWCTDLDEDGFGDPSTASMTCFPTVQQVLDCSDCDDRQALVNPGGVEVCNGQDDNCDGVTDPDGAPGSTVWYADADGDGYGADSLGLACEQFPGSTRESSDCDDDHADTHPGAEELCGDGRDNNCDGSRNGCGWSGAAYVDSDLGARIVGLPGLREYLGGAVGIVDLDGNGVDDVVISGTGAMYGGDSRWALHLWYGSPVGERSVTDASAHLVGGEDNFLAAGGGTGPGAWYGSLFDGAPEGLVVNGAWYGDGISPGGEFYRMDAGWGGERTPTDDDVAGVGWSEMEWYGSAVVRRDELGSGPGTLVVSARTNEEQAVYAGAIYVVPGESPNAEDHLGRILGTREYGFLGDLVDSSRDLNGDGLRDLFVTMPVAEEPQAFVYYTPVEGEILDTEFDVSLVHDERKSGHYGDTLLSLPDIDGDGYDDVALPWRSESTAYATPGRIYIVTGNQRGEVDVDDAYHSILSTGPTHQYLGESMSLGDIHADGILDLVVSASDAPVPKDVGHEGQGAVAIVPLVASFGGEVSLWSVADAVFYSAQPAGDNHFGYRTAVGDTNRDGFDDLLIGDPSWTAHESYQGDGAAYLLLGGGI